MIVGDCYSFDSLSRNIDEDNANWILTICSQRFAAFLSPLTSGRVTIAVSATYSAKVNSCFYRHLFCLPLIIFLWYLIFLVMPCQIGLATAIRYSLTRRAFSVTPNGPEVLILDYPSHQRRLLPLLAKT